MVFHHIPCGECYYCRHKVFAQCPTYKKVGATAGYEASGGGFAEYVRVMDWIVGKGVVRIPDDVSFEQASFIEPVNTCMKGIETLSEPPAIVASVSANIKKVFQNGWNHPGRVWGWAKRTVTT